jgi:proteasome alpha subunit
MPFYVSPEQAMKDKADYARKAITRIRSGVVITCDAGILFVAPNPSRALRKFSEIYDRIAFAAVGRYNEFERLRQAGVRYADLTGYQYDRQDVTVRGLANWYAQLLGTIFTESNKPLEVEIVVAEVGESVALDQIYRITFDGSVAEELGFVVMGGQAEQVATVVKERYSQNLTLAQAMEVAIAALASQGNGSASGTGQASGASQAKSARQGSTGQGSASQSGASQGSASQSGASQGGASQGSASQSSTEIAGSQLEVALLDRSRGHRMFQRLSGARLDALLTEARSASASTAQPDAAGTDAAGTDATGTAAPGTAAPGTEAGPDGPIDPPGDSDG